jgi:apolipoprotein N-acyltransferase
VKPLAISLIAGLVSALGFQPVGLWPLSLAAFALFLHLLRGAPHLRSALARGWWFGLGQFTLGLNWIATAFTFQAAMPAWLGWVAVLLLSLYLAIFPAVAAGLAWRWGRRDALRLLLLLAAAWIVTEWLRAGLFTGFAWNPAGVLLLPTFLSWLAPWIGTYGLSAIFILASGALWLAARRDWRAAASVALPVGLGAAIAMLAAPAPRPGPGVELRIVQPNIGQQDKWRDGFEKRNLASLERLSGEGGAAPRLLLWPEAAVTEPLQDGRRDPLRQREAARVRASVADAIGARDLLLTGGVTMRSADGRRVTSATNSVFVMDGAGRILGRYDKAHLVPYGEYLPMRPLLSAIGLSRLAPGNVDFDSGPGPATIALPGLGGVRVGFQLCYEIIFSGEVVADRDRPDFLFNPSNDAWFGAWGPPQHLAQARLRALEEGLPVLRSTPTGISALVDAEGRLVDSLPWRSAGVIEATLPGPKPATPFARLGNLLPLLLALLLAAIAASRKAR